MDRHRAGTAIRSMRLELVGHGARRPHEVRPRQSAGRLLARLEAPDCGRVVRQEPAVHEERLGRRLREDPRAGRPRRRRRDDWSVTSSGKKPWSRTTHTSQIGRHAGQPLAQPDHRRHVGSRRPRRPGQRARRRRSIADAACRWPRSDEHRARASHECVGERRPVADVRHLLRQAARREPPRSSSSTHVACLATGSCSRSAPRGRGDDRQHGRRLGQGRPPRAEPDRQIAPGRICLDDDRWSGHAEAIAKADVVTPGEPLSPHSAMNISRHPRSAPGPAPLAPLPRTP